MLERLRSCLEIIREENNQARVLYLNMLDESTLNADNFYVQRNDIIIVPALKARTSNTYTLKNISLMLGLTTTALSIMAVVISLSSAN